MKLRIRGWNILTLAIIVTLFAGCHHVAMSTNVCHQAFISDDLQQVTSMHTILSNDITLLPSWNHTTVDEAWIRPVAISKDGSVVVEGAMEMITLLNATNGDVIWVFNTSSIVMDVSISDNGSRIAASTFSNKTLLFERGSNESLWISTCDHYLPAVAISGDGGTIVTGDWLGRVYVFDASNNESLYEYDTGDRITEVCVSYNGSRISVGGLHENVFTFSRHSSSPIWYYDTDEYVLSVSVSKDGTRIVAAGSAGVFVFGSSSNDTLWVYKKTGFQCVDISDDGSTIAAGRSNINDVNLFLWDISSNGTLWTFNNTNQIRSVTLTSDGSKVAAGSYDNKTYLFGRTSNATIFSYTSTGTIVSSDASATGTKIVSSCSQGITHFFRISPPRGPMIEDDSRQYFNATETIDIVVSATRSSFPLSHCNVTYVHENTSSGSVILANTTPLSGDTVHFAAAIGPFSQGQLEIHATVFDINGYSNTSGSIHKTIDGTGPVIDSIEYTPTGPTSQTDVSVSVNVTDGSSGLDTVILYYSIDDTSTWNSLLSTSTEGDIYFFGIPSMANGTAVLFYVESRDNVGNTAIDDNSGEYYEYLVVDPTTNGSTTPTPSTEPELTMDPLLLGVIFIVIVLSLLILYYMLRRRTRVPSEPSALAAATEDKREHASLEYDLDKEETSDEI